MRIAVDAGHGGIDNGACCLGAHEKDITLNLAHLLACELTQRGHQVLLTRHDDSYITLGDRVEEANKEHVGLFISLHANADIDPDINGDEETRGFEVFHLENSRLGELFAHSIFRSLKKQKDIPPRSVKTACFYVLRYTTMPAVLIEVGFTDSPRDLSALRNPDFQHCVARLIAQGISEPV